MEDIPARGQKCCLKFSVKEIIQKQVTVNRKNHFTFEGEIEKSHDEEDNTLYHRLKSMKEPLEAQNIPDSLGNVSPEMKPV